VKVIVVEDALKVARFLARVLHEEGFSVDIVTKGLTALHQITKGSYDLAVLDWTLPDLDGLSICRELRTAGNSIPVMMLTARGQVSDRVLGLESGADDYLVKPFEVDEFVARVNALIRRSKGMQTLVFGDLEINRAEHCAMLAGMTLDLTVREYTLLMHLAHHAGRIVTRTDLLAQVWETGFDSGSNVVDVQISRLRDKLGTHSFMIETVRGFGYRLRAERSS
jgi:DNA-binding response OmpR family regulator